MHYKLYVLFANSGEKEITARWSGPFEELVLLFISLYYYVMILTGDVVTVNVDQDNDDHRPRLG